ncbi:hypothetical protein J6590_018886 [Homalodisca vitripennis]|nr:hypothetical protein J6590_018886 [Homalodisca vitripennis]
MRIIMQSRTKPEWTMLLYRQFYHFKRVHLMSRKHSALSSSPDSPTTSCLAPANTVLCHHHQTVLPPQASAPHVSLPQTYCSTIITRQSNHLKRVHLMSRSRKHTVLSSSPYSSTT